MLSFWQNVTGAVTSDDASDHVRHRHHDSSSKEHRNRRFDGGAHGDASYRTDDGVDEDELAERLLSRFPEYGSHRRNPRDEDEDDEDEDDAEDEDDEDEDDEELLRPDLSSLNISSSEPRPGAAATTAERSSHGGGGDGDGDRLPALSEGRRVLPEKKARKKRDDRGDRSDDSAAAEEDSDDPFWDRDEMELWKTRDGDGDGTPRHQHDLYLKYRDERRRKQRERRRSKASTTTTTTITTGSSTKSLSSFLDAAAKVAAADGAATTVTSLSSSSSLSSLPNTDRRQHWMPDDLCRNCYACETQFTVFRRRHHCRLCGQVFCNSCSAFFVELADGGSRRDRRISVRACRPCFDQVSDDRGGSGGDPSRGAGKTTSTERDRRSRGGGGGSGGGGAIDRPRGSGGDDRSVSSNRSGGSGTDESSSPHHRPRRGRDRADDRERAALGDGDSVVADLQQSPGKSVRKGGAGGGGGGGSAHDGTNDVDDPDRDPDGSDPDGSDTAGNSNMAFFRDETAYDESSFQALNLTKQKIQERERLALQKAREEARKAAEEEARIAAEEAAKRKIKLGNLSFDRPLPLRRVNSKEASSQSQSQQPTGSLRIRLHQQRKARLRGAEEAGAATAAEDMLSVGGDSGLNDDGQDGGGKSDPLSRILSPFARNRKKSDPEDTVDDHNADDRNPHRKDSSSPATDDLAVSLSRKRDGNAAATAFPSVGDVAVDADRHMGAVAAAHLERMCVELLASDAPLLLQEFPSRRQRRDWSHAILSLVTRACATVTPDVRGRGDSLDVRPYVKVKVVPGGSPSDCAYVSGVVFRRSVSHKRMAREIRNPRLMMLSGGIEYTRTANRISSLDILVEQEERYMGILVDKIVGLRPDVLLVGRNVTRQAQDLLSEANVVLIQHVKSDLMKRIARQTGATVLSNTFHLNQFGPSVLGHCRRFRLITFRDKEAWSEHRALLPRPDGAGPDASVSDLTRHLPHHERQAFLAADRLGENAMDGAEAVKAGLAKRGFARTYVLLEGCPRRLGCTVVLRGASRECLRQVKRVFSFLVHAAHHLRSETSYLRERRARLPERRTSPPADDGAVLCSSSLCVDYGQPGEGRRRPWNRGSSSSSSSGEGGVNKPSSLSGMVTAFDHQSILITSLWMTDKTQCCPAEVKGICYYSSQDVSLGQFLTDSCFNLDLKCQNPACKKSVLEHSLSFIHNDGLINITVEQMDDPLPPPPNKSAVNDPNPIATWTYCNQCKKVVTPLVYISDDTWRLSFGKFVEIYFYNRDALLHSPEHGCSCRMQSSSTLYFGRGDLAARFVYETVHPFGVHVRRSLPFDERVHRQDAARHLERISSESSALFVRFDKHIERVSREARRLLGPAAVEHHHLQTVLHELSVVGSEVDRASKTLHERIGAVTDGSEVDDEVLFRLPWHARRYLALLTSVWNERLSAVGGVLNAMRKSAANAPASANGASSAVVGDAASDEVQEAVRRVRQLREHYSQYNVGDMDVRSLTTDNSSSSTSRRPSYTQDYDDLHDDDMENDIMTMEDDLAHHGPDSDVLHDGVDSDVLLSRRHYQQQQQHDNHNGQTPRPTKSLGTRRPLDMNDSERAPRSTSIQRQSSATNLSSAASSTAAAVVASPPYVVAQEVSVRTKSVTPGGAVKSAITRFFNRGNREADPYVVDLGMFSEGRPRLEPGVGGIVVPVYEDQPSTVIAHSLVSEDYRAQFAEFAEASEEKSSEAPSDPPDRRDVERRMLVRSKAHIKHTFKELDMKGQQVCKFICTTFWATQFHSVRQAFLAPGEGDDASGFVDVERSYVYSLSAAHAWAASGGKSGASFKLTNDGRFVVKCISRTELQMFLDCAPAYFEYLSKAFFHGLPTVLCKIVGVYQIGYTNRVTGKRTMDQVAVMQNIFHGRKISKIFDLKGKLGGRFAKVPDKDKDKGDGATSAKETKTSRRRRRTRRSRGRDHDDHHNDDSAATDDRSLSNDDEPYDDEDESETSTDESDDDTSSEEGNGEDETAANNNVAATDGESKGNGKEKESSSGPTLLDGDFLEFTGGRPLPLNDRAKAVFHMSILNDTLFLSIINVLDYSILVGIDEEKMELVVGIIDFMRQYDILKQMERVGKSLPMVVGSEAPTIIQPPLYKARFTNAMERYFMTVPTKWTSI